MKNNNETFYKTSVWYQALSDHTFPTSFVKLNKEEQNALINGDIESVMAKNVIERLKLPMHYFPGNCFVSMDRVAPTDTERFKSKRGAVYSPESAWLYLTKSEKIKKSVKNLDCDHICIRPFRRMTQAREFRLFIKDGELKSMSQYWLIRHFKRLEGRKELYWDLAYNLIKDISWLLPIKTVIIDIYFTSSNKILIIDINPWGEPTSPLMLKDWNCNWDQEQGLKIIPPPIKLSGDVNVSF